VLRDAFADHGEAVVRLVASLRAAGALVPDLELVAEDGGVVAGSIAFSRAPLPGYDASLRGRLVYPPAFAFLVEA
jgi:predicted N-acetyltransferase YhbS